MLKLGGWTAVSVVRLNTICPYYTMYPLQFPLRVLRNAQPRRWVLDLFCGRGIINFAARLLGMNTVGFDTSPIAVAIASAKLVRVSASEVIVEAQRILSSKREVDVPEGTFWDTAFHRKTLVDICRLRQAIGVRPRSPAQVMLRALVLGILHGPLTRSHPSYFSNQCPRTFAPKPAYAVRFWKKHGFSPRQVDALDLIDRRARHCLSYQVGEVKGYIRRGDARDPAIFESESQFSWIITSPPYYGMRTYIPDQWLRNWFVGGPPHVSYVQPPAELAHSSPEHFSDQLRQVWQNVQKICAPNAHLICRFGGIKDRDVDSLDLLRDSLRHTPWRLVTTRNAGTAHNGKRQACQFGVRGKSKPKREYDLYARLAN